MTLPHTQSALRFSVLDRAQQLQEAKTTRYDLIIIGGGVTGSGIALDAAARGLKVCLIEKNDFASGTSNKSTKLIHGGLRYLKQLEIALVKESGSERAIVHQLAPHLVVPEKMLLPLIEGGTYGKLMTALGLKVYDFLANVEGDDRRKMLNSKETSQKEPLLDKDTLIGGGYYAEYRTDDARLTIELLKKAVAYGANCINYCEMKTFLYSDQGKIEGLQCLEHNSGATITIKGHYVIAAAGPWVDTLRRKDNSMTNKHLRLTKGVHLVVPREKLPLQQSIYFDVADGRMIFAIPRGKVTYLGTTDTNYKGDLNRVVATKADAQYLLDAVNAMFPTIELTLESIESNWAGLRPLIHEMGKDPSELSRKDELFISDSGLIAIAGGKLTGYRKMAQRAIATVLDTMSATQQKRYTPSQTATLALTSDPLKNTAAVQAYTQKVSQKLLAMGLTDPYYGWYLTTTYGKQTDLILEQCSHFDTTSLEEQLLRAELWYSIHYEMTNSLTDFFVRRTGRLYFDIHSILHYRDRVLQDCIAAFSWNSERIALENKNLDLLLQDATTYYDQEF